MAAIKCWLLLIFVCLNMLFLPGTASAVDGYKNLKFGMSKQRVADAKVCSLYESDSGQVGVDSLECSDFEFGGSVVQAGLYFIEGELLRLAILVPADIAPGLIKGLTKKYGAPMTSSSQKEFEAIDVLPNRSAFIAFDKGTVVLKLMSHEDYSQSALLFYSSPRYDVLLVKKQQESIGADL